MCGKKRNSEPLSLGVDKSIDKEPCENYLFEDYRLKSGITIWILTLKSSGETVEKDEFECRVLTRTPFF
jgi:hypothetical protein